jgi:hypothetical protein
MKKNRHREPRSGAAIQMNGLDCFVGFRLLAMTPKIGSGSGFSSIRPTASKPF